MGAERGRWRTVVLLVLGGLAAVVVDRLTGGADWGVHPVRALTRLGGVAAGMVTVGQAVLGVTGKPLTARGAFGLPVARKREDENRDALREHARRRTDMRSQRDSRR
jgi:hypothetical protein